ncbi:MAG: DUF3143 domain-containing protein [Pleurocapsa sp.]
MSLPEANTPLYNHTLPTIDEWLRIQGCDQDQKNLHCWYIDKSVWKAEICLETEELSVRYFDTSDTNQNNLSRSFKYSLSREDVEDAVFSGP